MLCNSKQPAAIYDQIAWFEGVQRARPLSLTYVRGDSFDFTHAMPSRKMTPVELSWCLSDHLPLWAEFQV